MKNIRDVIVGKIASELIGKCMLGDEVALVSYTGKMSKYIHDAGDCDCNLYRKIVPPIPEIIYKNYNFNGN